MYKGVKLFVYKMLVDWVDLYDKSLFFHHLCDLRDQMLIKVMHKDFNQSFATFNQVQQLFLYVVTACCQLLSSIVVVNCCRQLYCRHVIQLQMKILIDNLGISICWTKNKAIDRNKTDEHSFQIHTAINRQSDYACFQSVSHVNYLTTLSLYPPTPVKQNAGEYTTYMEFTSTLLKCGYSKITESPVKSLKQLTL